MIRALALLALIACAPPERAPRFRAAGNATPRNGGTLRVAITDRITTLDPAIAFDEYSFYAVHALFDTLVDYAPGSTRIVPRLAESWDISADGLVYSFHLRDHLAYSDGSPVRAADFAYSLARVRGAADSPFASTTAEIADVQEPSDRELVIRLAHANAGFLDVLAEPFTTPQRADRANANLRRDPLGSGPYMLARWSEGQELVLAKNPHYWDPARAHVDAIDLRESVPRDAQFLMFEHGELDAIDRPTAPDLLWLRAQPAWQPFIHATPVLNAFGSRMNTRVAPFSDRRVRQALNFALSKEHAVTLVHGTAVIAHGILPPGVFGRDDALAPYPHDPVRARALLAQAGYGSGFDVDYTIIADDDAERLAGSLAADLAEVGVRVHIHELAFATYATAIGKPDGPAFSQMTWIGDTPDATAFLDQSFHSRAIAETDSVNNTFYSNRELDALLDAARAERDDDKRAALYHRAERIIYDDAPWLWTYHQQALEITQPYVKGLVPHPIWGRDFAPAWLDVDANGEPEPAPQ